MTRYSHLRWGLLAGVAALAFHFLPASPALADSEPANGDTGVAMAPVGAIGWVEFAADRESGQAFFSKVFGWQFEPYMDGYDIYTTPAGVSGGYRNAGEDDIPVLPFIVVADIDAAIASLVAEGAQLLLEKEPVGEGSIAVLTDCSGNPLGLTDLTTPLDYHPAPFGDAAAMIPNAFCGIEIYGGDLNTAAEFYSRHFGWACQAPEQAYMGFNPPGGISGIFQSHSPKATYVMYIWVEDVDPVLAAVVENGGSVEGMGEPGRAEGSPVFAYFLAPGGTMFGLMAPEGT